MSKNGKKLANTTNFPKGRLGEVPLTAPPSGSFYNLYPKFSLIHAHHKFCLSICSTPEKADIINLLHGLSKLTWGQIWETRKHTYGAEPLPKTKYDSMPQELRDKSDKYIVFRFNKTGRLIGFHEHDTLHIVWLDPKHKVCKTG